VGLKGKTSAKDAKSDVRLKMLLRGAEKAGKTWAAIGMPAPYVIDSEGGARLPDYRQRIEDNGGMYFGPEDGSTDPDQCVKMVEELMKTKHPYKTLVWDSYTVSYETVADQGARNPKIGTGFNANYRLWADPWSKRILNTLIPNLDLNVILTSHVKDEYKDGQRIGTKTDGHAKSGYMTDLTIEVVRTSPDKTIAYVKASRYPQFKMGDSFVWSVDELRSRWGNGMDKEAEPVAMASPEQIAELLGLFAVVLPDPEKQQEFLEKNGVDSYDSLTSVSAQATIDRCKKQLEKVMNTNTEVK